MQPVPRGLTLRVQDPGSAEGAVGGRGSSRTLTGSGACGAATAAEAPISRPLATTAAPAPRSIGPPQSQVIQRLLSTFPWSVVADGRCNRLADGLDRRVSPLPMLSDNYERPAWPVNAGLLKLR